VPQLPPPTPLWSKQGHRLYHGEAEAVLRRLPSESVQCVVTSPPYYGLRDYGTDKSLEVGAESTVEAYIDKLVAVFRGLRRVLRPDGVAWLNLGDTYANTGGHTKLGGSSQRQGRRNVVEQHRMKGRIPSGYAVKNLLGVPWRVALALQEDGWTLRQDVIWHKPSPMPESVTDRCTRSHEYVFMLTKGPRYYYDVEAIKEPTSSASEGGRDANIDRRNRRTVWSVPEEEDTVVRWLAARYPGVYEEYATASRTCGPDGVWRTANVGYKGAHFATFPAKLITPMILAGTSEKGACPECGTPWHRITEKTRTPTRPGADSKVHGTAAATHGNRDPLRHVSVSRTVGWRAGCSCDTSDTVPCVVLDPFVGSGTTVSVAAELGRQGWGIDLSEEYLRKHAVDRVSRGIGLYRDGSRSHTGGGV